MMLAFLTGDDLFAHILLMRNVESKAYLVLEGPTDCAMLDPHIDGEYCASIAANGKLTVVRAMQIVEAQGLANVAGVVDRDLEELVGTPTVVKDVFFTDMYDMEAVAILNTNVFARVVSATCDRDRLAALETSSGRSLRQLMIDVAFVVAYLRYVSARDDLGLKLRDFPLHLVLTADARVDGKEFADICTARSKKCSLDSDDVFQTLTTASVPDGVDAVRMCCGHDLIAALFAIASRFLGASGSVDHFHRVARAALDCASFLSTTVWSDIRDWGGARGISVWTCA